MGWNLAGNLRGPTGQTGATGPAGSALTTKLVTATRTSSVIALADVTDLTNPIAAGQRLMFRASLRYTAAAATTGLGLGVNGPVGSTLSASIRIAETATTDRYGAVTTLDGSVLALASAGATPMTAEIEGTILAGAAAGTLAIRFRSEIAASAVNILAGSTLTVWT